MSYQRLSDLPKSVRDNLPRHAQEIYRASFNNAWDEYGHDAERAHRVAWDKTLASAVNRCWKAKEIDHETA